MNSHFHYQSNFLKIVGVAINHDFYEDGLCKDFAIVPTAESAQLMRNHSLLYKATPNGFLICLDKNSNYQSEVFAGALRLEFVLKAVNRLFINFTDIPYSNQQYFNFKNKPNSVFLTQEEFVSSQDISQTNSNGISGLIQLELNTQDVFMGSSELNDVYEAKTYLIQFKARNVILRYNFYTSGQETFDHFYLKNDSTAKPIEGYKQVVLPDGRSAYCVQINGPIAFKQFNDHSYTLKRKDMLNSSYSKRLSSGEAKNINVDLETTQSYCDVFVKFP